MLELTESRMLQLLTESNWKEHALTCLSSTNTLFLPILTRPAGYLLWFHGHVRWHAHDPDKSSHFVQEVMKWYRCDKTICDTHVGAEMSRVLLCCGISDLRLDIAEGLLPVLSENHLSVDFCLGAMDRLEACQIAFPFLRKSFVCELVDLAVEWMGQDGESWINLRDACFKQIIHILDAILPVDKAHFANRCATSMAFADLEGRTQTFLLKKQQLMDLLSR